jgi:LysM repeat protein
MRIKHNPVWLAALSVALLTLAACVRPYPQEESAAPPTPNAVESPAAVQPELPVPTPIENVEPVPTLEAVQPTLEPLPTEAPATDTIHVVQPGDTLFNIASQYGVTIDVITAVNDIPDVNQLEVGQEILIPAPGTVVLTSTPEIIVADTPAAPAATEEPASAVGGTHVVQAGENLFRIGMQYGCSADQMAAHNGIPNAAQISVGQVLQIPDCN